MPIRYGRMASSPFAFFRGAASGMAWDLASVESSGLTVQLCGDAHLANFGGFGSPERELLFDVNDFDETLPGPFEWDLKRLVGSFAVMGRERALKSGKREALIGDVVRSYVQAMTTFASMPNLQVWYQRLEEEDVAERWQEHVTSADAVRFRKRLAKAHHHDSLRALSRLTTTRNGTPQFISRAPLLVPLRELEGRESPEQEAALLHEAMRRYRAALSPDLRQLVESYRLVDAARKVVGVGSVGTRCWVVLLLGVDERDPLVLQLKEAGPSVLERHLKPSRYQHHGRRVVEGQRLLQAAGDVFLGWDRVDGFDGQRRDFYVRQLWDWKLSVDLARISVPALRAYAGMCGWMLARGHARSGDRVAIAAYLGSGTHATDSLVQFAESYADQTAVDHAELREAIDRNAVRAYEGI